MSEWQPIETAPKDGTPIFVYRYVHPWHVRGVAYWVMDRPSLCGWIAHGVIDPPGDLGLAAPTHWQPLPEPPA